MKKVGDLINHSSFSSRFVFGDHVTMDGDSSLKGTVTAFQFRSNRDPVIEVQWFMNGDVKTAGFDEWRLARAEK